MLHVLHAVSRSRSSEPIYKSDFRFINRAFTGTDSIFFCAYDELQLKLLLLLLLQPKNLLRPLKRLPPVKSRLHISMPSTCTPVTTSKPTFFLLQFVTEGEGDTA